ncbi:MAG: DEAD/DEAH box helicase [Tissierellia bacterium]|nr:DEAD/DEAH box helicase [Tissierellia bacterium]
MNFTPHKYQEYCIDKVLELNNVGLFLDMGLGKTIITLMAIKELKFHRFQANKILVIAPKKVAEGTWQLEKDKWEETKSLRVSTVIGPEKQRLRALYTRADVYIINRENVTWLVDHYKNDWPFDTVVVDEFSSFKNPKAKRFLSLASVKPHIKRLVGLTGTPSPNSLADLWSQLFLLDGGERLGKKYSGFRERYFDPGQRNGYVVFNYTAKKGSEESILAKISDICVSMKAEDYLSLPEAIEHEIPVILDTKAQKAYNDLEKKMVLEVDSGEVIDVVSAAALSNKLLQLSNGAIYDEDHEWHEVHSAKIEAFIETIESLNGKPALVFYNFQHDKDRILEALKKLKIRVRVYKSVEDQKDWNDGKIDVLLTHPASSAYGLNLQAGGNHIIWFGLNWNYELYTQANKRLHRQGQKETVFIHHLVVKGSRDEDVMEALRRKEDVQNYVLESLKARIEKYKESKK